MNRNFLSDRVIGSDVPQPHGASTTLPTGAGEAMQRHEHAPNAPHPASAEPLPQRAACDSLKITRVICQILRGDSIEQKTASCQDVLLVRIEADNGMVGIGEADSSPEVVKAIIDTPYIHTVACGLRQLLVGENPLEQERLWRKMYDGTVYFGRSSVTVSAMAAIDMALWDLKGKYFNQPIHRLLGGKHHDKFKAYASILFAADGEGTRQIAQRWRDAGYQAIKFGWAPMGQSEALDIE